MNEIQNAYEWFVSDKIAEKKSHASYVCSSRDVFNARLSTASKFLLKKKIPITDVSLITALVGEIGNNCFDHNVGSWKDISGAYFCYDFVKESLWVVISDRGQGLFSSLKKVIPQLKSAQEAIDIAFHKYITGRAPEQRGNGLKFVRETLNLQQGRGLFFQTNGATHVFGSRGPEAAEAVGKVQSTQGPDGTFALMFWTIT